MELNLYDFIGYPALGCIFYIVSICFYRLYFHPLSKFPGPLFAALSTWYEGYYDIVKKGRYIFEVEKMHKQYGPIVRIGPNELHILDADYYEVLYSQANNRLDKYDYFYSMLGNPEATFPTIKADIHRRRRGALNPFFSVSAVAKIEPTIHALVNRLAERMELCAAHDEVIPLFYAYRCLTVDVISEYAFGRQLGLLDRPDWGESFYSAWRALWEISGLIRQIPVIMDIFQALPRWILAIVNPQALEVVDMQIETDALMKAVLSADPATYKARAYPTFMWEVAQNLALPPEEKTFKRLAVEGNNVLAAGFETTGSVLTLMTYLVLEHTNIHERLMKELAEAIPDPHNIPSWQVLEKLPLLSAVVKESLRLAVGAFSRLPRVNPHEAMHYKEWTIPPGTAVGMSNLFISMSPTIFPSPRTFDPDRWSTPNSPERHRLEKHLHPFGKGSRMCIAQNMAYAEMYGTMATLIRRFPNLRLWETSSRDMEYVHDYFAGMTRHEHGGLKVKIGKPKLDE